MIVLSPSKILQNPLQDPPKDLTGTYRPTQEKIMDSHFWIFLGI